LRLQASLTSVLDKDELCVKSRRGNEEEWLRIGSSQCLWNEHKDPRGTVIKCWRPICRQSGMLEYACFIYHFCSYSRRTNSKTVKRPAEDCMTVVRFQQWQEFFSSPLRQVPLWDPLSLLSKGLSDSSHWGEAAGTRSSPLISIRYWYETYVELYLHFPVPFHDVVLESTRTTLMPEAQACRNSVKYFLSLWQCIIYFI
jgi:hypothetical protein